MITCAAFALIACQQNTAKTLEDKGKTIIVAKQDAPIITFEKDTFDFGKIKEGDKVEHEFNFKNTGKTPLIITNATPTCGCTVPEYPTKPIMPGEKGIIKVVFNSQGKMGMQDKVVTLTSNANPAATMLHLTGEVLVKNTK